MNKLLKKILPAKKRQELPSFVINRLNGTIFLSIFLGLASLFMINDLGLGAFVIIVGAVLVFNASFYFLWYLKFANDEALYYDFIVLEQKELQGDAKKKIGRLLNRYVRKLYKMQLLDGSMEVQVVMNDTKAVKKGDQVRIYTVKEAIVERSAGEYIINSILYAEKIH